jgi:hypothetical protein
LFRPAQRARRQRRPEASGRYPPPVEYIDTLLNEAAAPITLLQHWNPDAKK